MAKKNAECEVETEVLLIDETYIKNRIYMVRGQKVMFQLTKEEFGILMSQGLISKNSTSNRGGRTKPPKVFTEQGIYTKVDSLSA